MRLPLPVLVVAMVALTGCAGDAPPLSAATPTAASSGYSQAVRGNFLTSCVDNARTTADGAASEQQLESTCECILGKVETEYSEAEFAGFEQRLLGGAASQAENDQLVAWSTACADESRS